MLADLLNRIREQAIREMEQRADTIEGPGFLAVGRAQRLTKLLDELISALCFGGVDEQKPAGTTTVDPWIARNASWCGSV